MGVEGALILVSHFRPHGLFLHFVFMAGGRKRDLKFTVTSLWIHRQSYKSLLEIVFGRWINDS